MAKAAYASQVYFPDLKGISPIGSRYDGRMLSSMKNASGNIKSQLTNNEIYMINAGTGVTKSTKIIRVEDLVGSRFCLSSERGEKLYKTVKLALRMGMRTHISFDNITDISSAFLDSAIGELYNGEFPKKELIEKIVISGLTNEDTFILRRVTERAENYFRNSREMELNFEHDNC